MTDSKGNRSREEILAERIVHVDVVFAEAGKIRAIEATAPGITILPPAVQVDFIAAASAAAGGKEVSLRFVQDPDIFMADAPEPMGRAA